MATQWDGTERRRDDPVKERIDRLDRRMDRFEVAMFARDSNNDFGRPGLMVTADRLDNHLDALCKAARFAKWFVGIVAGMAGIGKALGWW